MRTAIDYAEVAVAYAQHRRVHPEVLLISDEAFRRGIARMEEDLRVGPIAWVPRYCLVWGSKSVAGQDDWTHKLPNDQSAFSDGQTWFR